MQNLTNKYFLDCYRMLWRAHLCGGLASKIDPPYCSTRAPVRRSGFKNLPTLLVNKGIKYMLTIYIQFACIYFIYHKKHFLLYALHIFAVWAVRMWMNTIASYKFTLLMNIHFCITWLIICRYLDLLFMVNLKSCIFTFFMGNGYTNTWFDNNV